MSDEAAERGFAIPGDLKRFIHIMTTYREEVNGGTPQEWGESIRELAETASQLCIKYGVNHIRGYEESPHATRAIYSDGSKGRWE